MLHGCAFLQAIELSHRDLKPENLALDDSGQLKIIDFGFAKDISELIKKANEGTHVPTKFNMTIGGTPDYMAPELINSLKEKNPSIIKINSFKTDVFSFGLIILEIGTLYSIDHKIDLNLLDESINTMTKEFKENYHGLKGSERKIFKQIFALIQQATQIDDKNRPDFLNLFQQYINFYKNPEKTILHIFIEGLSPENTEIFKKETELISMTSASSINKKILNIGQLKKKLESPNFEEISAYEEKLTNYEKEIKTLKELLDKKEIDHLEKVHNLEIEIESLKKINENLISESELKNHLEIEKLKNQLSEHETMITDLLSKENRLKDLVVEFEQKNSVFKQKEELKQEQIKFPLEVKKNLFYFHNKF